MYKRIGEALRQAGHKSHPTDWLLFLCPGKREAAGPWLKELDPPTDSVAKLMRTTLRGPIYVHSKMMIVDDVYLITGSANINQARALADIAILSPPLNLYDVRCYKERKYVDSRVL